MSGLRESFKKFLVAKHIIKLHYRELRNQGKSRRAAIKGAVEPLIIAYIGRRFVEMMDVALEEAEEGEAENLGGGE